MSTNKAYNTSGTDIKSILLNLSSILVFALPFVWYFATKHIRNYFILTVVGYAIAYLTPPTGWRRPHPYSDDPNNIPMGTKQH